MPLTVASISRQNLTVGRAKLFNAGTKRIK